MNINHNGKACVVLLVRGAGSGTSCENVRLDCKGLRKEGYNKKCLE